MKSHTCTPLAAASAPVDVSFIDAFGAALHGSPDFAWLDSAVGDAQRGRRSLLALELEPAVQISEGVVEVYEPGGGRASSSGSWKELDDRVRAECVSPTSLGWLGYVAYEAAVHFDPALGAVGRKLPFPELRFDRVRAALVTDGRGTRLEVTGADAVDARRRLDTWRARLSVARSIGEAEPLRRVGELDGERHRATVAALRQRIGEGRIYQACYTHPIEFHRPASLGPHYVALRRASPGDYGAYLRLGDLEVASSSPERFFRVDGRRVECRPMKGTRARLLDPIADAEARRELAVSEKDRAENVMIVDLMRNDIGRVCELGSVVVPVLYEVETYATVHQLTSTVVGTLRPGVGVFELLEAVFPPGSMTGAPKVAACTLLAEVESRARGLYAGTVGWIGYDGRAEFSVVIRTLQAWGDVVRWDVGGGVVWDSTPEGEWAEAMHKADALRRAGLA